MGFCFLRSVNAKKLLQRSLSNASPATSSVPDVPKGYLAVYVGNEIINVKRFVIPVSYLNQPIFQELLSQSEEEFGFDHPMGGLTIPCSKDSFSELIARLNAL